ncbi:cytochrome P450 [Yinghuangia aomiensis]
MALLRNPRQLALLRETPDLTAAAVDELARFDTPTQAIIRVVAEDTPSPATTSPPATSSTSSSAPPTTTRPASPIPTASTSPVPPAPAPPALTFGHGPHFCLGAPLARLQTRIALATTLRRFPNLGLAVPQDDLTWHTNPLQRRLRTLPVTY